MKDLTPVLFILLGCALAAPRAGAEAHVRPRPQEQARRLEQMIRSAMKKNRIVGLSATVLSEGESLLCAGWGHADGERRKPVTAESLFPIGSVTKLFTATAVMQLVERGKVDLDAPLSRYLPELAGSALDAHEPTVRQVLTHHAGIPGNYMEGFELEKPVPEAFRQLPRLAAGLPPACAPDTVFAYSNEGYALLGSLVERAGGMPYGEAVTRGILEPLGMSLHAVLSRRGRPRAERHGLRRQEAEGHLSDPRPSGRCAHGQRRGHGALHAIHVRRGRAWRAGRGGVRRDDAQAERGRRAGR